MKIQAKPTESSPFGQSAVCGARVARVVAQVGDAIHGHSRGARANHGDDNPENLAPSGKAASSPGGEQRAHQCKGEGEDGVLKFDHLQDDADAAFCHRKIRQIAKSLGCVVAPGRNFSADCFLEVTSDSIFWSEPGRSGLDHL